MEGQNKTKIKLRRKTRQKLVKIFKKSNTKSQLKDRVQMVLLRDKEKTLGEIKEVVCKDVKTIIKWLKVYEEKGLKGLKINNHKGNNNKLSKEQLTEIKQFLNCNESGFTSQELRLYIKKNYQVEYRSNTSLSNIFYRCQFSFRKPEKCYAKSDLKEVREWKKKIKKN